MRKHKILHCLFRVGSGGVEQRRLSLARNLDPDLFEQKLICTDAWGGLLSSFKSANCEIFDLGQIRHIADSNVYRNAFRVINEWQPDIIHGAVYEGVAIAAVSGRLGKVPIVIGEETSDPKNRRFLGHALYRFLASLTHHMVAVSPAVQRYLISTLSIPAHKVSLINNGVFERMPLTSDVIEKTRVQFGLHSENFVIGTVGRLVNDDKRVSDLIRALAIVQGRGFPHVRLLVVGDGPDRNALADLASALGVENSVIFAGYQSDPQPLYGVMDVFALASASEAFGLVLVEAMFEGLPVIATNVGGIPGVVEDSRTGLLVPPMSPVRLADAMQSFINDQNLCHVMGARGRDKARAEFSEERYVADVDRLYKKLLSQAKLR